MNLILREITLEDKDKIYEMYNEYISATPLVGIDTFEGIRDFEKLEYFEFPKWIETLELNKDEKNLPQDFSPQTIYIALNEEDKIVGAIGLRWKEVPVLMNFGGFVGYSVRPKERGKGYATEILRQALEKFKDAGRDKILISCKNFNDASKKKKKKNEGVYDSDFFNEEEGYTYSKYWVNIK